jgi:hypothetical protein
VGRRTIFAAGHIDWDDNQIRIMLVGPDGEVSQEVQRRARAVQRRAQTRAPFRTGELRGSIHVNTVYPSDGAVADITAEAPHALAVEFGRRRIDVRGTGRTLVWTGSAGETVFSKTAAAVPGVFFMRDALDAAAE